MTIAASHTCTCGTAATRQLSNGIAACDHPACAVYLHTRYPGWAQPYKPPVRRYGRPTTTR